MLHCCNRKTFFDSLILSLNSQIKQIFQKDLRLSDLEFCYFVVKLCGTSTMTKILFESQSWSHSMQTGFLHFLFLRNPWWRTTFLSNESFKESQLFIDDVLSLWYVFTHMPIPGSIIKAHVLIPWTLWIIVSHYSETQINRFYLQIILWYKWD